MVAACALCIQCRMLPSTLAAYGPAYDCMCFGHPGILIILQSSHNSRLGPASELPEGMLSMSWRMPVSWLFSSSVPWAIPGVLGSWSVLSSLCFLVLFPSRVCKHAFCFKFLQFSRASLSFSVHYRFTAGQASTGGTLWSAFVVRNREIGPRWALQMHIDINWLSCLHWMLQFSKDLSLSFSELWGGALPPSPKAKQDKKCIGFQAVISFNRMIQGKVSLHGFAHLFMLRFACFC